MYLALIISVNPQNKNGAYGFCCFKCKETKAFMLFYTHTHKPCNEYSSNVNFDIEFFEQDFLFAC